MRHPTLLPLLFLFAPVALLPGQTTAPATQPAAPSTQPAPTTQPHPPITKEAPVYFTTMESILLTTPPALRPQPTEEWSKYSEYKFVAWWKQQIVGLKFDKPIPIITCTVSRTSREPGKEWQVTLHFGSTEFPYFGAKHTWFIGEHSIQVDETTAKKWDLVKRGAFVPVKATIRDVTIGKKNYRATDTPQYGVSLDLTDITITLPK